MTLELVTRRWGVTPLGVERGGERREKEGSRDRLGENGRRDRGDGTFGRDQEKGEGRSERGGWEKGKRGGQIKYR